jgi:hypothetical protein
MGMPRIYFDNDIFIHSLREYLEHNNEHELLSLLSVVKVEARNDFNYYGDDNIDPYRHDLLLKVPVSKVEGLKIHKEKLHPYINEICVSFGTVFINRIMIGLLTAKEQQEVEEVGLSNNHLMFYKNLINEMSNSEVDNIEKVYIIESCRCLLNGNNLAAATMLGCAIERVIILFSLSYQSYLRSGKGTEAEIKNFTEKVVNKSKAIDRLTGLINHLESKKRFFDENGFENASMHLRKFDIIRQLRNDVVHPSGELEIKEIEVISEQELFQHLVYYSDIFKKTHNTIKFLNRNKSEER